MRSHRKQNMFFISMLGIIAGGILSRLLSKYFGSNATNVVAYGAIMILFCAIVFIIIMGYYFQALILLAMSIPIIVGGIGLYIDNMHIVDIGFILMFIIYPVLIITLQKLRHNK